MANRKDQSELLKIILTAVITTILTLCSSYFLLTRQFEKEQQYWVKRTKTERLQNLLDRQTQLFEEINSGILRSEVMAKDLKLYAVEFTVRLKGEQQLQEMVNLASSKEIEEKQVAYQNQLNELASKIQMAELYFGVGVDTLIRDLGNSFGKNFRHNLIFQDSFSSMSLSSALEFFKKDFETIDLLQQNRLKFLKAMRADMLVNSDQLNDEK
jgi:hypothetical protein